MKPSEINQPVRAWALSNRGIQKDIAEAFGVTRSHVNNILKCLCYSDGGRIEGALAELGAPGMRARQKEAILKTRGKSWTKAEIGRLLRKLKQIQADKARRAA